MWTSLPFFSMFFFFLFFQLGVLLSVLPHLSLPLLFERCAAQSFPLTPSPSLKGPGQPPLSPVFLIPAPDRLRTREDTARLSAPFRVPPEFFLLWAIQISPDGKAAFFAPTFPPGRDVCLPFSRRTSQNGVTITPPGLSLFFYCELGPAAIWLGVLSL